MSKMKTNTAPRIFENQFTDIDHEYSTRFKKNSFVENQLVYSQKKYSVSSRGPKLWSKLLDQQQKSLEPESWFKKLTKLSLLSLENEIRLFQVLSKELNNNLSLKLITV